MNLITLKIFCKIYLWSQTVQMIQMFLTILIKVFMRNNMRNNSHLFGFICSDFFTEKQKTRGIDASVVLNKRMWRCAWKLVVEFIYWKIKVAKVYNVFEWFLKKTMNFYILKHLFLKINVTFYLLLFIRRCFIMWELFIVSSKNGLHTHF